jgi:hypothetical protein
LIERGIGETRYARIDGDEIVEARIELDGVIAAGNIVSARLLNAGARNAVARDGDGNEYLLPAGAPGLTEGAQLNIEVMREAIPGAEPWKRPLAKPTDDPPREASEVAGRLARRGEFGEAGWDDLIDEARTGTIRFAGGELRITPTAAMTLIDVDGALPPEELALCGATAAAKAIRRLDIGGSIGIDLPTTSGKAARQQAAAAIDAHLPQPFERTAVNGFGFVQIVRPRRRASLLELAQDRAAIEARALLRRAAFEGCGARTLVAHPAVIAVLEGHHDWLDALARQLGGEIGLRADASLAISGGYAEAR